MAERIRTAVLISGRGTNLQALIEGCSQSQASAEIALVVSDQPDASGLERAQTAGVTTCVLDGRRFARREEFDNTLNRMLQAHEIRLVCLAGFMRILGPELVRAWRDRLLNVHPSLLPAFRGLDTHRRALEAGVRFSGCTVHFVRSDVDAGPIIVQGVVPVSPDETSESLAARVLEIEHRCYPLALELVASGRARVEGERVVVEGTSAPSGALLNPMPSDRDVERPSS